MQGWTPDFISKITADAVTSAAQSSSTLNPGSSLPIALVIVVLLLIVTGSFLLLG